MRIGLVPLDERPANVRYPGMIAAIAGAEIVLPPVEALSSFREPAPIPALHDWLLDKAPTMDALIVSLDMLCHGGLIASRTTDETTAEVVSRLRTLRELRAAHPDTEVHAFSAVTRIPDADDASEEPVYWARHGRELHLLSALTDRRTRAGHDVETELETVRHRLPPDVVGDFAARRLRNHVLNLAALELAADGVLDSLVLCSDDTGIWGMGSGEQRWLQSWTERLGLGPRVFLYPGADEVGCTIAARLINAHAGRAPRIAAHYFPPDGKEAVAPYENVPVAQTVERQIIAVGAETVETVPDLYLAVNSPTSEDLAFAPPVREGRRIDEFAGEVERARMGGLPVAVADVAYANGADTLLVETLRAQGALPALAAYSGWNTAGNTVGTALAQGCAALVPDGQSGRDAQELFSLHRILEDWGYQAVVRDRVRRALREETGSPEPDEKALPGISADIERQLSDLIETLPHFAGRFRILPGSTSLPWGRTFECDFGLQRLDRPKGVDP